MTSLTRSAADLLTEARTFRGYDTPGTHRVSRCADCGRAYCWKGSAPRPACPLCGGRLSMTTRMLKAVPFIELAGDLLAIAELKPNGLADAAKWERTRADELEARGRRGDEHIAAGKWSATYAGGETVEYEVYYPFGPDRPYQRAVGSSGGSSITRSIDVADRVAKHRAKADRYDRRAEKLEAAR